MAAKYNWNEWFDGRKRFFEPGRDFEGPIERFRNAALVAGYRRGIYVWTKKINGMLALRAIGKRNQGLQATLGKK